MQALLWIVFSILTFGYSLQAIGLFIQEKFGYLLWTLVIGTFVVLVIGNAAAGWA